MRLVCKLTPALNWTYPITSLLVAFIPDSEEAALGGRVVLESLWASYLLSCKSKSLLQSHAFPLIFTDVIIVVVVCIGFGLCFGRGVALSFWHIMVLLHDWNGSRVEISLRLLSRRRWLRCSWMAFFGRGSFPASRLRWLLVSIWNAVTSHTVPTVILRNEDR